MHAPDGLLNVGTALATGAISLACVSWSVKRAGADIEHRAIPLAGVCGAFLFAAQMINVPVAVGASGHILGAALAAILLGPHLGSLSSAVVVLVQALLFADGGLTALGYNTLNLAIIPAFGGYALFLLFRRLFPATTSGVVASTGFASAGSVLLAAAAFSIEWLFGATVAVPFDTVFGAMVGAHLAIGIGEGLLTAALVSVVIKARPDIVFGARDIFESGQIKAGVESPIKTRSFALASIAVACVLGLVVSQFASGSPDGLERVVEDTGIGAKSSSSSIVDSAFADYATAGIANQELSLAVAAGVGLLVTGITTLGIVQASRIAEEPGTSRRAKTAGA